MRPTFHIPARFNMTLLSLILLSFHSAVATPVHVEAPSDTLTFTRIMTGPVATDRASSGGVAWIDFDGDGDPDLFVSNGYDVSSATRVPQDNRLYRNVGDGVFERVASDLDTNGFTGSSTWADFDNDGDLDAFLANINADAPSGLYRSDGDGRFTLLADAAPSQARQRSYSATWGDADNDGFVDLFVSNGGLSATERNLLYRNTGDGRFERVRSGAIASDSIQTGGASWVDFDLDGDVDLFVPGATNTLYRNDGDWVFTPMPDLPFVTENPLLVAPISSAWGDYDNDGDMDVYITYQIGEENRMYRNLGDGSFERVEGILPVLDGGYTTHAAWADFDQDGWLDLLTVNWGSPAVLYRNLGSGDFERRVYGDLGLVTSFASGAATADYDGDGDLDVIIGHWPNFPGPGEENLLYENRGASGNWVQFDLEGTRSNRSAIGARIVITSQTGGVLLRQTRELRSQDGWRSQHALSVHFGLGRATSIEKVDIYWPSGHVQTLTDIPVNQRVALIE